MAGTVVTTETTFSPIRRVKFAWTSDAAGAADAVTTASFTGKIIGLTTVPSGGGTAPTNLYDIVITDSDGLDVLVGAGANRSSSATEQVLSASLGFAVSSTLTLAITNAGNAKQGTVYLHIQ